MKTYLVIFLLIISNPSYTQNLIRNGSFEEADENSSTKPDNFSQLEDCKYWTDDKNDIHPFLHPNTVCVSLHSPDWLVGENYQTGVNNKAHIIGRSIIGYNPPNNTPVYSYDSFNGNSGMSYCGMGAGELAEQNLDNSLEQSTLYKVTFFIRLVDADLFHPSVHNQSEVTLAPSTPQSIVNHLKFFIATQKIKYHIDPITCNGAYKLNKWDNFKDLTTNTIHEVSDVSFSRDIYPIGAWHKISFSFTTPSNHSFDWFGFEVQHTNDDCGYPLIDDISLYKVGCDPSECSQTSGEINPIMKQSHRLNNLWNIDGLDNVSHCKIDICNYHSQDIYRTIEVNATNGIKHPIYWDGKKEDGSLLAIEQGGIGHYMFRVTLDNDCIQNKVVSNNIHIDNNTVTNPMTLPVFAEDNSGLKIPKLCCQYDLDIENRTLNYSEPTVFSAYHNVTVATAPNSTVVVTSNSNIKFQGGELVEIGPGFETETGATVEIAYGCPPQRIGNFNTVTTNSINPLGNIVNPVNNSKVDDILPEIQNNFKLTFSLKPNPANANVLLTIPVTETTIVIFTDMLGQTVIQEQTNYQNTEFNIAHLPKGIYFVSAKTATQQFVSKLVKE
jgi:hypothetical protein